MHEIHIAKSIINKAKEKGDVKSILVEVGELAHLPAYELEEVLKNMVNWDVNVAHKNSEVMCHCGYVGKPHILEKTHSATIFFCPECNSIPKVLKGDKITLKEVVLK